MNSHYTPGQGNASPVFTPAFASGFDAMDALEDMDEQLGFELSLDSPTEFVFSNDIAYDEEEVEQGMLHQQPAHDDKASFMRSIMHTERDTSSGLMMARGFDAFIETNVMEASNGKAPVFVLDKLPSLSPVNNSSFDFFSATLPSMDKCAPASPHSPVSYINNVEVPEKDHSDFFSVNPVFTSSESPSKIMDTLKAALSTLRSEVSTSATSQWSLSVSCLLVAEEINFSIHLYQLRGASAKYEVEFVRHAGDELMFADLSEHIRAECSDIDAEGALALFSKTLDAWMDDKQELVGRRFAIKETEAATLLDELNCEFLHPDSLYEVAKTIKNHCRHKGNRKLLVETQCGQREKLLKGLAWMLKDCEALVRFALFILLQYANDEELCSSFFATPLQSSNFKLELDDLSRKASSQALHAAFTAEMVDAVRQSALFA